MTTKNQKNEIDLLIEISEKLDNLISLLLVQGKEKEEQIQILVNRAFSNSRISQLLGIPKGTVDTIRAKQSKKKS